MTRFRPFIGVISCFLLIASLFSAAPARAITTISSGSCQADVADGSSSSVEIFKVGNDCVIKFKSGTNSWTPPSNVTSVRVLLAGGGGAGGAGIGGGGGAGELFTISSFTVTPGSSISTVVGAGGAAVSGGSGSTGGNSQFGTLYAYGGGGGGVNETNGPSYAAGSGGYQFGSGGGGGYPNIAWGSGVINLHGVQDDSYRTPSVGTGTAYRSNGGFGSGGGGPSATGGGGGGAGGGGAAGDINAQSGGAGGAGISSDITGSSVFYSGGGGGGVNGNPGDTCPCTSFGRAGSGGSGVGGNGGTGGGGTNPGNRGGDAVGNGFAGAANTGSGGGGASNATWGGDGGSGVVIVRYLNPRPNAPTISVQPAASTTINAGDTYTVSVSASTTDAGTLSYQWKREGVDIAGATSSTYTLPSATTASEGQFSVVVTNTLNGITASTTSSVANLVVNLLSISNVGAPTVAATTNTLKSISVSWTTVTNGGTYKIRLYRIADSYVVAQPTVNSGNTYTFTSSNYPDLLDNTSYDVSVQALGGGNYSGSAESSKVRVLTNSSYTITYSYDGATGDSSTATSTYITNGTAITLPAPTKTGYTFDGWYEAANLSGSKLTSPYSPTQTRTIYAKWLVNTYTVTYKAGTGASGSDVTGTFTYGNTLTLGDSTTALTRSGYTISGWSTSNGGGKTNDLSSSYSAASDLVLYPVWSANTYTVTYKSGTGATGSDVVSSFVYGNAFSLGDSTTAFTKAGYTITGWSTSNQGSKTHDLSASYSAAANLTLYPVWSANTLVVTYNSSGGSIVNSGSVSTGGTISSAPTAPTRAGYTFLGWFDTSTAGNQITFPYSPSNTASFTLYAQWSANNLTVTYNSQGGTSVSAGSVSTGGTISSAPTAPTRAGYTLVGWFDTATAGNQITFPYSPSNTTSFTLYAQWSANNLTVTYNSQGGTSVSAGSVSTGGTIASAPTAPTRDGYTLVGWFDTATAGNQITFPYLPANTTSFTLYAQWSANTINVTFDSNGGSAVSAGSFLTGATLALPSNPTKSRKYFGGWSTSESADQGVVANKVVSWPYASPATSDFSLYAIWFDDNSIAFAGAQRTSARVGSPSSTVEVTPKNASFTWEAWIYPTGSTVPATTKIYSVLDNGDDGNNYGRASVDVKDIGSGPFISFGYYTTASPGARAEGLANSITYNKWQHVAVTAERTGASEGSDTGSGTLELKIYLDGIFTTRVSTTGFSGYINPYGMIIGDKYDVVGQPFKGRIDQVKVWDGVLTADEIVSSRKAFAASGVNNNLRAHYSFNELSSSPASGDKIKNLASSSSIYDLTLFATTAGDVATNISQLQNSFTVSYDSNTATSGSVSTTTGINPFEEIALPAGGNLSKTNYNFAGWNTKADGTGSSYSAGDSFTVIYGGATLYAKWSAQTYTVTYKAGTGGSGSDISASFIFGNSLTLGDSTTALTKTGYYISGWSTSDGGSKTNDVSSSYSSGTDLTLYPVWSGKTYAVTYKAGTGGSGSDVVSTFTYGNTLTLGDSTTALTKSGYYISGWSTTDGGAKTNDLAGSYSSAANLILYPVWTAQGYTVTYKAGTGGSGNDITSTFTFGNTLTLGDSTTAFTRTGYSISGWSTSNGGSKTHDLSSSYSAAANLILYPVWSAKTYVITYKPGTSGTGSDLTQSFIFGNSAEIKNSSAALIRVGYYISGWATTDGGSKAYDIAASYSSAANLILYPVWAPNIYTVSFDATTNGGTALLATSETFTVGGTQLTLPAPIARSGYSVRGWYDRASGGNKIGNAGDSYSPTSDTTMYFQWSAINYRVTYNSNSATSGSVPLNDGDYNIGNSVVVSGNIGSLLRTGYTFAGWTDNVAETGTVYTSGNSYTVGSSNINFYAKWTPNTYTVTYNANGASGSPTVTTASYTTGSTAVTLTSVGSLAKTGFTFDGWSLTPTGSKLSDTFTTSSDVTLYAKWNIKTITASYLVGDASDANPAISSFPTTTTGTYNSAVTLATPSSQVTRPSGTYQFTSWLLSGTFATYGAGASFVMPGDDPTFVAQWAKLYQVDYTFNGGTSATGHSYDSQCISGSNLCLVNQVIQADAAPSRTGYQFLNWRDQSGNIIPAGDTFTVTESSYRLYAQWQAIDYTITYLPDGGASTPTETSKQITQSFALANAITRTGYSFAGWDDGSQVYGPGAMYIVGSSPVSLTALWTPDIYTVTYDWNGGSGSTTAADTYTVGTNALLLPVVGNHVKDGYQFSGWSTTSNGLSVGLTYTPTGSLTLFAVWGPGSFTITYNANGGSVGTSSAIVANGSSAILPTPTRTSYIFNGWFTASSGGNSIGAAQASFTPLASATIYAQWVQASLAGISPSALTHVGTLSASNLIATSFSGSNAGSSVSVSVPAGALPNGTDINLDLVNDFSRAQNLISNANNYVLAIVVSWVASDGTVPDTAANKPITVVVSNPAIKRGMSIYSIVGSSVDPLGVATQDGSISVELTTDPEVIVAATKPNAPDTATATVASSTSVDLSWLAPSSDGGSVITSYTATANSGQSCTATSTTSCTVTGLSASTAYTFTVVATNAIGTSTASPASASVTTSAAPSSAPVVTRPSTTTSTAKPTAVTPSDAIRLTKSGESILTAAGDTKRIVNGVIQVEQVQIINETIIRTEFQGVRVDVQSVDTREQVKKLDSTSTLVFEQNGKASLAGGGFKPTSTVRVWIFSSPTYLGEVEVSKDGLFQVNLLIPSILRAGNHTLQINGITPNEEVISQTIGVLVVTPKTAPTPAPTATPAPSATPTPSPTVTKKPVAVKSPNLWMVFSTKQLKPTPNSIARVAAFKKTIKSGSVVTCNGYITKKSPAASEKKQALERARLICKAISYLKGVKVKVTGVAPAKSWLNLQDPSRLYRVDVWVAAPKK